MKSPVAVTQTCGWARAGTAAISVISRDRANARLCLDTSVIASRVNAEAIQSRVRSPGLLRGACRRAALRADPLARNDEKLAYRFKVISLQAAPDVSIRPRR